MLEFKPESLESMRCRLPAALSTTYDVEALQAHRGKPPCKLRQHVFDYEDGIRCVLAVDRYRDKLILHLAYCVRQVNPDMTLRHFLSRIEAIPVEFWPDTLLLLMERVQTKNVTHELYEFPSAFRLFLKDAVARPPVLCAV